MMGVELSFERLMALRRLVFGLGPLQVVVTCFLLGLCFYVFGAESR